MLQYHGFLFLIFSCSNLLSYNALATSHVICTRHQHTSAPTIIHKLHHSAVSPPLPATPRAAATRTKTAVKITSASEI
ncbi:hypothetical protein C8F04DRAFT_1125579 [Mycena alexandri]|uniref:Secreted protein n=1 Tax=Mycena alexandri TaxID=1745969 RepID=A0AAD6SF51_9AGAR|nr:hypothetical protein C8F04DRAFT_1125579 [Mycena alexandri]